MDHREKSLDSCSCDVLLNIIDNVVPEKAKFLCCYTLRCPPGFDIRPSDFCFYLNKTLQLNTKYTFLLMMPSFMKPPLSPSCWVYLCLCFKKTKQPPPNICSFGAFKCLDRWFRFLYVTHFINVKLPNKTNSLGFREFMSFRVPALVTSPTLTVHREFEVGLQTDKMKLMILASETSLLPPRLTSV